MAFPPPRPGMMPPMPPFGMVSMGGPPPSVRAHPPPPASYRAPPVPAAPQHVPAAAPVPTGPPVTVFVGNITERAQDAMIRHLLTSCGPIISWKRVQGATGRLQAFGFCEYANPDAAARAIRLLHDMLVGDKKLVVKVDAKTKDVLDEYKRQRRKSMTGKSPTREECEEGSDEDFIDAAMKHEDSLARDRIKAILMDHSKEMMNYVPPEARRQQRSRDENYQTGPKESLDDVEMEDGKRDIIHREIDKFRETMKLREAEKEEEKKKRETETSTKSSSSSSRRRSKERSSKTSTRRSASRSRSKSFSPVVIRTRSRDKSPEKSHDRSRDRSRERDRSRDRDRSRERSRDRYRRGGRRTRSRTRSRSRSRDRDKRSRSSREVSWKEREKEEEEKEVKREQRKARDKEAKYQERLRKWENREIKMQKEMVKERNKEKKRAEDTEKEASKLREFLEDYDDDRDDSKYYQGRELERRLQDRAREAQKDAEDRQREKEEIEELKAQIAKEGYVDPAAELQRRLAESQASAANEESIAAPPEVSIIAEPVAVEEPDEAAINHNSEFQAELAVADNSVSEMSPPADVADDATPVAAPSGTNIQSPTSMEGPPTVASTQMLTQPLLVSGRRKLDVKDVFNQDDDDVGAGGKKKKLPLLSKKEDQHKTADDKRKHAKSLIEKIPTDKKQLFEYKVDWDLVDNQLMEKRIRPWVDKKITEYIGEPEPTLTDFICSKVLAGSTPKAVLDDVQMVLDEEAEVFVVKMWRLLIYEIANKKHKAGLLQ